MNDTPQAATPSTWNRLVGVVQVVGGSLEVTLGSGMMAAPTGITQVGGVILIAHGGDTIVAGFRSIWTGQLQSSGTQQLGAAAARGLGASEQTAQIVGNGVDLGLSIGPSLTVRAAQQILVTGARSGPTAVAIAYLPRRAWELGHNAVGIRQGSITAWYHLAAAKNGVGRFVSMPRGLDDGYVTADLLVTAERAASADAARLLLAQSGRQTWGYLGPNCSTTVLQVLRAAGIVVPEWSRTPFLLHLGARAGTPITIVGGVAATGVPALMRR